MYLKNITLKNFRSFEDSEIALQKDLTVFVGENNGGKSNGIDAVRLLTTPLGGRRELYCESTDVRFQSEGSSFELSGCFAELSVGQQGRFITAAKDESLEEACFGIRFDTSRPSPKPVLWGGRIGNTPEPGCHDMVRHVYLPTLRDAQRSLASGNPTRIMALLNHFLDGTTPAQLAKELGRTHTHDVLAKVDSAVARSLTALTAGVRQQTASVGFSTDEALVDIARDLRFKLADHGVDPEDLRYSGHGYANLLFMAIIAVELEKVRSADLTLFLVEEPEAHLHPQLQAAVLAFLGDQATQSRKVKPVDHAPAGELQVIVATHSPNLSAWVSSDRLVVFKSVATTPNEIHRTPIVPSSVSDDIATPGVSSRKISEHSDANMETLTATMAAASLRRSTRCIALSQIPLDPIQRRKVDRYLDVTKAALLFGGRVLLMEGIAETLLLPVIAKHHTFKNHPDKLLLFKSTVFIPIDGVDFDPYATLLLTSLNGARIADRVVIITDGDKGTGRDELEASDDEAQDDYVEGDDASSAIDHLRQIDIQAYPISGELRKAKLTALAEKLGASAHLAAITSTYSLETELLEAGNESILRKAYLELHPRSSKKWDVAVALKGDARAKKIHNIFKDTRKGDFAQILATLIENGEQFSVPMYIAKAIEQVIAQ